ncbi:hypothetical protein JAAARDRAFT_62048 [Jaapia argillacea MUCL 33604]|uniref:Uncharacterized protein n=1 Tax=Jaapia argillacea MUCL 33604 TaxID=933084 RepID=A0A067PEM4_9AGAM|nr:hypothetical protein JAAARDRAFT_62048 [Jaapia argillacea MUCL 33604]
MRPPTPFFPVPLALVIVSTDPISLISRVRIPLLSCNYNFIPISDLPCIPVMDLGVTTTSGKDLHSSSRSFCRIDEFEFFTFVKARSIKRGRVVHI